MAPQDPEEVKCEQFLKKLEYQADPTWGFYVYGTYARPKEQEDTGHEERDAPEAAGESHFQAVLSKLHSHAADAVRYSYPAPYNQKMIDTMRLEPAAYLPGASLVDVCTHFRQHYADPASDDDEKCGPKWSWCLVVDDDSLKSIESGPEPIGHTRPENKYDWQLSQNAYAVFVNLLSIDYTTIEPVVLSVQSRTGGGRRRVWNGWLKFSIITLKAAYSETASGDPETFFESPDKIVEFLD